MWINLAATIIRRVPLAKGHIIEGIWGRSNQRFLATMAPELGGYAFDCCIHDVVARSIFFAGAFAQHEAAFMREFLKPGMCFVDVGAYWGLLTMLASHLVGSTGRVLALEPDPTMRAKLNFNLALNRIVNVSVSPCAATDENTELTLQKGNPEHGTCTRLAQHASDNPPQLYVPGRRLDDLLDEFGVESIDLVKIDVEGAEDLVLHGMAKGLERHRYRSILLELHPTELAERSRTMAQVAESLLASGYCGYSLDSSRKGCRKAYYHPFRPLSEFILPLDLTETGQGAHASPHTVWLSPDMPISTRESLSMKAGTKFRRPPQ
jgi:FkbM family methyltransferase